MKSYFKYKKEMYAFCKYLLDTYVSINCAYEDSRIYYQLKQFYEEGQVKGIIYKNTKLKDKSEWLTLIAIQIDEFYGVHIPYNRGKKANKLMDKIKEKS